MNKDLAKIGSEITKLSVAVLADVHLNDNLKSLDMTIKKC